MKDILWRISYLNYIDDKDVKSRTLKLAEECGEVAEAVLALQGDIDKELDADDVVEECADVIINALSIIMLVSDVDANFIRNTIMRKYWKWENGIKEHKEMKGK